MQLPDSLLNSLEGLPGFDRQSFEKVHAASDPLTSIRLNPSKCNEVPSSLGSYSKIPWATHGYYIENRPSFTFDPLFHSGAYYVQEASSMFIEHALKQTVDFSQPLKVLDLCAAPGGKSTHISSLLSSNSFIVSNEVIRSRANILKDNIIKWGTGNVIVTSNDAAHFTSLNDYFDVIVVDAPCSGSGLFRKDPSAIEEWSENNVALCHGRQQRILHDIMPALKNGGILLYATCSYSKEEDEDIIDWIKQNNEVENLRLNIPAESGIRESITNDHNDGYRFWPNLVRGEGFFISAFKKNGGEIKGEKKYVARDELSKKEFGILSEWMNTENYYYYKHEHTVYAWPRQIKDDFIFLKDRLKFVYSGIRVGELIRDKLVPDHALALNIDKPSSPVIDVTKEQAIQYLQKKELSIPSLQKGWSIISFEDNRIGWVNVLPGRINNYYPKELRILKDNPAG